MAYFLVVCKITESQDGVRLQGTTLGHLIQPPCTKLICISEFVLTYSNSAAAGGGVAVWGTSFLLVVIALMDRKDAFHSQVSASDDRE